MLNWLKNLWGCLASAVRQVVERAKGFFTRPAAAEAAEGEVVEAEVVRPARKFSWGRFVLAVAAGIGTFALVKALIPVLLPVILFCLWVELIALPVVAGMTVAAIIIR